ncbi:MAG: FAD-binding protein [Planctomycetales bacterium]
MLATADFQEIIRRDEPLAPHTWMKVGGPAQYLIEPRTFEELSNVLQSCREEGLPYRILGGGSNLLVKDEGVSGVVLKLSGEAFSKTEIQSDNSVTAGAGCTLSNLISHTVKAGLAGLETLVGIPGSVGGALHGNAGGKSGDIGQFCESVTGLNAQGEKVTRSGEELFFEYRSSNHGRPADSGSDVFPPARECGRHYPSHADSLDYQKGNPAFQLPVGGVHL